jgi:hypothetical protein
MFSPVFSNELKEALTPLRKNVQLPRATRRVGSKLKLEKRQTGLPAIIRNRTKKTTNQTLAD